MPEQQDTANAFTELMAAKIGAQDVPASSTYRSRPAALRAKVILLEEAMTGNPELAQELSAIGARLGKLADETLDGQKALLAMQREQKQGTRQFRNLEMQTARLLQEEATLRTVTSGLVHSKLQGIKVTKPELEQLIVLTSYFDLFDDVTSPEGAEEGEVERDGRDEVEIEQAAEIEVEAKDNTEEPRTAPMIESRLEADIDCGGQPYSATQTPSRHSSESNIDIKYPYQGGRRGKVTKRALEEGDDFDGIILKKTMGWKA